MDTNTGPFEYDADSESSQRSGSVMSCPLISTAMQPSRKREESASVVSGSRTTASGIEEPVMACDYSSGIHVGDNQHDITDAKASDKSNIAAKVTGGSVDLAAFSELYNFTEGMKTATVGGLRYSTSANAWDSENLETDRGCVSDWASSSTVTDFLEGCLDNMDSDDLNAQPSGHSQIWASIFNTPTRNTTVPDHNAGITPDHTIIWELGALTGDHQQEYPHPHALNLPLSFPSASQAECDFVAGMLIPTTSEDDIHLTETMIHVAWSQAVSLPYVRPLHALDIDILSNPPQHARNLIPTRPATPTAGEDKESAGDKSATLAMSSLSAREVAGHLTLWPSDSTSLYSLFGTSPPSSQTSAL